LALKKVNFKKQIAKRTQIFNSRLGWNKARATLLAYFIVALIKIRTVNLTKIAVAMPGKAKTASKYKRLQRFFAGFNFDMEASPNSFIQSNPLSLHYRSIM